MARLLRLELPNTLYYVSSRGNAGGGIFEAAADYELFLKILGDCCEQFNAFVYSYCLLYNSFHLALETREANLGILMKRLLGIYSLRFNRIHRRRGHLFQERYKAHVLEKKGYLLALTRFIHLTPCRAELVSLPEDYPWSSMQYFFFQDGQPKFLETETILSQFASPQEYRQFVLEKGSEPILEKTVRGIFLGSPEFVAQMRKHLSQKQLNEVSPASEFSPLDPQRVRRRLELEPTEVQIYGLWYWGRMKQREIGHFYSKSHSAISHAIKRFKKKLAEDPVIRHRIKELEREISTFKH